MNNFQMYCLHFWKPCQVWTKCRNEIVEEETLLLDSRPPGIKSHPSHSYNLGTSIQFLAFSEINTIADILPKIKSLNKAKINK